jgi:hypothetical protein
VVAGGVLGSGRGSSAGEGADLDQVVAEYPVPVPDGSSIAAVQPGAVPAVSVLEVADPAFAAGRHLTSVRKPRACSTARRAAEAWLCAGWRPCVPRGPQVLLGRGLAVPAVGGDRAGRAAGAPGDPADRRRELGSVRRVAGLDAVIGDDAVVVVGDLGLFCRVAGNAALSFPAGTNALLGAGAGSWEAAA